MNDLENKIIERFDKFWVTDPDMDFEKWLKENNTKDYEKLKNFLKLSLQQAFREGRREAVEQAFDWVWGGWNLDLANKDRAKKQFLSKFDLEKEI